MQKGMPPISKSQARWPRLGVRGEEDRCEDEKVAVVMGMAFLSFRF